MGGVRKFLSCHREPHFKNEGVEGCVFVHTNVNLCLFFIFIFLVSFQFLMSGWANGYSYGCDLVDYSSSPQALRVKK